MKRPGYRLVAGLAALVVLAGPMAVAEAAPGPASAPEWWFDSWHATSLWAGGADGHGITIAVIDTGVQANIPELSGKILPGADFIRNGTDGRTDFDSEGFSHGTAMASLMVARPGLGNIEGLVPNAQVLPIAVPLKGVIKHGEPSSNPTSDAIDYAVAHGAKIISMSLGGVRDENTDGPDPCPTSVQDSVLNAVRHGVLVVAASGNSGDSSGSANSPVEEPGVCLGVVSVGAVDASLNASSFSSRHPYLTLSAPGDNIPTLSRDSAYIGGGTSQATAITSAALAMVWSKYPTETARQILTRMLTTATDRGPTGRDSAYGYGVINPEAAIGAAVPAAGAPNSVFDGVAPLLSTHSDSSGKPKTLPAAHGSPSLGRYAVGSGADALPVTTAWLGGGAVALLVVAILAFILALRRKPVAPPPNAWSSGIG